MSNEKDLHSSASAKTTKIVSSASVYVILSVLAIIWLFPILWVVFTAFRAEPGSFSPEFIPKTFTLQNFSDLWANKVYPFRTWFANTLLVAVCTCVLSTMLTLTISYVLSRMRFKLRKPYMNMALVLGMFPGFMSMIAVYYVLKSVGMTQSLTALVLVYSAAAGINFYICIGFFDTVAIGMFQMVAKDNIYANFRQFNAGCLFIGIPIVVLFVLMQRLYVEGVT